MAVAADVAVVAVAVAVAADVAVVAAVVVAAVGVGGGGGGCDVGEMTMTGLPSCASSSNSVRSRCGRSRGCVRW